MEQTTSFCHLCGALLKRRTRRCSSCGSAVNRSTTTPEPKSAPQVARPSSGDAALSEKLQPLQVKKNWFQLAGAVIIIPMIVVVFYFLAMDSDLSILFGILGAAAGGTCFYKGTLYTRKKKELISTYVIQGMLADNFELVRYAPKETFTEGQLRTSQLRGWNTHKGNDWFQATYKGVTFTFSDVGIYRQGRHRYTVLKGQWLILRLHKEISAPLIISELEKRGALGRRARVQIEQKPFGDIFTVLTESPAVISQVLTPGFMEFLLTMRHSISYVETHLFFGGEQAHIGLNTREDLFEPCNNVQDIPALRERVQTEIDLIKRIIDGFLLTEGLFQNQPQQDPTPYPNALDPI
ncbi:MAG: DUF3137 domain-containing protein [Oscillospiraceae bacterium]|nr:DUF3137 domain-containing protein [Oscillospiraceae bacterium]